MRAALIRGVLGLVMLGCGHTAPATPIEPAAIAAAPAPDAGVVPPPVAPSGVVPPPVAPSGVAEYHLTGAIVESDVVSIVMFFGQTLATQTPKALVWIDSGGGDVDSAKRIGRVIEAAGADGVAVTCRVDGMAASAAFYILQSCPVREMTRRSTLMTHEPTVTFTVSATDDATWENARAKAQAEAVAWASFCSSRLRVSRAEYDKRVHAARMWWFRTPEDAIHWGAIDRVAP